MVNVNTLKENTDLRQIVEQDLGQPAVRSGRASLWKCPFHGETKGYSLAVWQDGYRCFGKCDTSGDLFDWMQTYRRLSFTEAVGALDSSAIVTPPVTKRPVANSEPPPADWQAAACQVVRDAEKTLWSDAGEAARHYLYQRGLTDAIIRDARFGYIPGDYRGWRTMHGLRVPCGISIPWFAAGALWAVKVRRAAGEPKYVQIAGGSAHGLYGADYLPYHSTALFCEGEFDVLLARQEAGDLVCPVTLGSATARLTARWRAELSGCPTLLVAYDNDTAGRSGAEALRKHSQRFRTVHVPFGKDISEFYLQGGDLKSWIAHILDHSSEGA